MKPVIEVHGLVKHFGSVKALDGLELLVQPGEISGFLGPNGAGKSTTIRILMGLIKADSGVVKVLGNDPWIDSVPLHQRIAFMPGDISLWPNLTGGEIIDLLGRMAGDLDQPRKNDLIERFELDPSKKARTYSKGNRQKVALIAAFSQKSELLIFDEPTTGLDPLMHEEFTKAILEEKAAGKAILLSSHILAEVEKLCDSVTIIRKGRTVEAGLLADLRHLTRSKITATLREIPPGLESLEGVEDFGVQGDTVHFSVENSALSIVLEILGKYGISNLVANPPDLEELFLRFYESAGDPK